MKYLGAFFSTVLYNNKQVDVNIAVVDADRHFGLLRRDILNNSKDSIEQFEEKNTGIETYDKHKMKYLGASFSTVLYNNKQVDVNIAVVDADRNFGLLRRDILNNSKDSIEQCFEAEVSQKLPTVKGAKAFIELKPDAKPMFCAARKVPLPVERKVNKTIDELILLGILEPLEAGGVDNCSPVVWVKKGDELRMCAGYKNM